MSSSKARVLVTRPKGQEVALSRQLAAAGYEVVHQPLLNIEPLTTLGAAQKQLLLDLDTFAHVIFVSANAVQAGCDWIEQYWPQYPVGVHWYGPGPGSARALEQRGLAARSPDQRYDSEGLLALPELQQLAGEKVLLVKGVGGRKLLHKTCTERGAGVSELVCYRRDPVPVPVAKLKALLDRVDVVALSSGSASEQWAQMLKDADCASGMELPLVVPGANAVQRARAMGFEQLMAADSAADADILAVIKERWA